MTKFWDIYGAPGPDATELRDDVYNKLLMEGWFGRPQPETSSSETDTTEKKKPNTIHGEVVSEPKSPGTSDGIYEEVWGNAPTFAEVYGQVSSQSSAPAIAPPEAPQVSNGPEPEL
jgi:hypothetical protein